MTPRIEGLLRRVAGLLAREAGLAAPLLDDDRALRREAARLRPCVEAVVGRPYGRLPRVGYRRGLEARLAGPWSQYLTLGVGASRVVRMTPWAPARPAIPTILAHELAHRYSFDESLTTLRGLEVSARLAEAGDALHARSVVRELARVALGAAMDEAVRTGRGAAIDDFLADHATPVLERSRLRWQALRARSRSDAVTVVYQCLPCEALERCADTGARAARGLPFPRFPLDSLHAALVWLQTAADSRRRRAEVPLEATLRLWSATTS